MKVNNIVFEIEEITKGEKIISDEQLDKLGELTGVYIENCGISGTNQGTLYALYLANPQGKKINIELAEVIN